MGSDGRTSTGAGVSSASSAMVLGYHNLVYETVLSCERRRRVWMVAGERREFSHSSPPPPPSNFIEAHPLKTPFGTRFDGVRSRILLGIPRIPIFSWAGFVDNRSRFTRVLQSPLPSPLQYLRSHKARKRQRCLSPSVISQMPLPVRTPSSNSR